MRAVFVLVYLETGVLVRLSLQKRLVSSLQRPGNLKLWSGWTFLHPQNGNKKAATHLPLVQRAKRIM